ncbi:hypothetical protein SEA_KERBEROS_81 [Mycobacterium phage Kerberos]|uniref:putative NTPase n=1 Tax=Mycobacterium phage Chy5 TaxID=1327948 RepID=UPI00032B29A7|nr:putative NTPase [Mycobacterium phage Chy5]APC43129.1 hypothetical protein SEA_KERBEROS_81 [Mycobacterium phage Kerberos]AXH48942.1 hypothetical protein SEA_TOMATHAN_81 [Mycobacterium phage Tomathan]QBP28739.1 hypothetical protein SEA_DBQU4N_81 [Mycobacterium phage DBQu4n]UXE05495.1 hypothetical protein SEA_DUPLO_82 [Mycobacterium phage Duplo]AGK86108.1 putative NTPase [Mycobacterium phage Chy5]
MKDEDIEKLKSAYEGFKEMLDNKYDFINEQTNDGQDEPEDYGRYDEAVTDYNYELAYLGELLADAVAEALGIKEDS